jgi:hypothetical protein
MEPPLAVGLATDVRAAVGAHVEHQQAALSAVVVQGREFDPSVAQGDQFAAGSVDVPAVVYGVPSGSHARPIPW